MVGDWGFVLELEFIGFIFLFGMFVRYVKNRNDLVKLLDYLLGLYYCDLFFCDVFYFMWELCVWFCIYCDWGDVYGKIMVEVIFINVVKCGMCSVIIMEIFRFS